MRKQILFMGLAIAAFMPAAAMAQALDLSPDNTRYLYDPAYLPLAGQLYGTTNYGFVPSGGDTNNAAGARSYKFSTDADDVTQTFAYGITNDLSIGVSEGYSASWRKNEYQTGAITKSDNFGFTDPTFGLAYRAVDQGRSPVNLDLHLSYAPDAIDERGATVSNSGSVAAGRQVVTFNGNVSREMRSLTVMGLAGATWDGHQKIENATTDISSDTNSYWAPFVGATAEYRITDRLAVNPTWRTTFNTDTSGVTGAGLPTNSTQATDTNLGIGVGYHFIPNRLVGILSYGHDIYSDATTAYPTHPTSNTTRTNYGADTYGVHLQYVFF